MNNNNINFSIIDENPFNYLSNNYKSLDDDYNSASKLNKYKIDSAMNPPSEYQNRLVANQFPYKGSEIFEKQYPELANKDHPRKVSPQYISTLSNKNNNYVDIQNNINAGIPPVQIYDDIATNMNQSVKIPSDYSNYSRKRPCYDYINHYHKCPYCTRYFEYEKNIYKMIIIMIIIVAAVIIWFLYKDGKKNKSSS